ncbi:protein of unknown function DUF123 [Dehalogenimonas lykanthroporepellens BL-DC-9]|nr:protein of unknown function DUF123 [Dehalogenimonas lykanthroporepellens BL-DC-9]
MTNGIYAILLDLPQNAVVRTRCKVFTLDAGYYTYIGSAMSGLEARINRHLRPNKRKHWHIDYLLERSVIFTIVCAKIDVRLECAVADGLAGLPGVSGFGATDCRCRSHLFFSDAPDILERQVMGAFERAGLDPLVRRYHELP